MKRRETEVTEETTGAGVIAPIGCYLYETDKHGSPIMGNILFVGDTYTGDGITFSGIEEEIFNKLYEQLKQLAWKAGAK